MRAGALAALLVVALASSIHGQSPTAEGVDAFMQGNYQLAARILKPLAEQSSQLEPVAAFFMALMYDNGFGVTADPIRACALYLRADRGPFGEQAMALSQMRRAGLGREAFEECNWRASVGFDHGFEPVTFALGPAHWIAWDIKGATITYQGQEKRFPVQLVRARTAILPLRYTELLVGHSRSTPRHFIEILTWEPQRDVDKWALRWALMEVVRTELIGIASEQLRAVSAPTVPNAPADRSLDVRSLVRLDVNDEGDAEWALVDGSKPPTAIETEGERADQEEDRQARRAREVRDAGAGSKRTVDIHRPPALGYVDADTCFQSVVGWSVDRVEAISVASDGDLLKRNGPVETFDLTASRGVHVTVHVYDTAHPSSRSCSDVGPAPIEESWRATKGTVTVQYVRRGDAWRTKTMRRATISITGGEFVNRDGVRVRQLAPIVLTTIVP